jgi:hypothetical protein
MLTARNPNLLYIYGLGSLFTSFITVCIRSTLIKIVGKASVGKCFAVIGAVAAISSFIQPLFQVVWSNRYCFIDTVICKHKQENVKQLNYSLDWHPGLTYCIVATLVIINTCIAIYAFLHVRMVKSKHGRFMVEEIKLENN